MKLISMTDYVLEMGLHSTLMMEKGMILCNRYANFLKRPLELGMFIPCVGGEPLEKPSIQTINEYKSGGVMVLKDKINEYQKAKESVLFDGFEFYERKNIYYIHRVGGGYFTSIYKKSKKINGSLRNATIEDLIPYNLTLTKEAINNLK